MRFSLLCCFKHSEREFCGVRRSVAVENHRSKVRAENCRPGAYGRVAAAVVELHRKAVYRPTDAMIWKGGGLGPMNILKGSQEGLWREQQGLLSSTAEPAGLSGKFVTRIRH